MTGLRYAWVAAIQSIRSHRLRTGLTAIAIVLSVSALVTVDAAAGAAESAVVDQALLTNGLPATWGVTVPPGAQSVDRATRAAEDLNVRVRTRGGAAALVVDGMAQVRQDGSSAPVNVVAIAGPLVEIRPYRMLDGSWLGPARGLRPEIVINAAATEFGLSRSASASLEFGARSVPIAVSVIGVVQDGQREPTVYVPLAQFAWWRPTSAVDASARLLLHVDPGTDTGEVLQLLSDCLERAGVHGDSPMRLDDLSSQMVAIQTLRLAFFAVAILGLLTGMLGILNIGLATLPERVVELALRRAAGATRGSILTIMVAESVLIGALAATIAVIVAYVTFPITSRMILPQIPAGTADQFPLFSAVSGIAAGMLAGLLGGVVPAIRAAALDIATIMRA